jgi:hypothetical protein
MKNIEKIIFICRRFFIKLFNPISQSVYRYLHFVTIETYVGWTLESTIIFHYRLSREQLIEEKKKELEKVIRIRKNFYGI